MPMQEGIFYAPGMKPYRHFAIMFLRAEEGANAASVGSFLANLWSMYQGLKAGRLRDLPSVDLPDTPQQFLIGYGPKSFSLAGAGRALPDDLGPAFQLRKPNPSGGGKLLASSGLSYANGVARNPATEEIMVQVIAETPLATNRAIVETWKLIDDSRDRVTGLPAVQLAAAYSGFNREDERSWIDFHDGTSNLKSGKERFDAIAIKRQPAESPHHWTEGGTYMAFMRLSLDLAAWRRLSTSDQELLVGRSKTTGCAIADVRDGIPEQVEGCPFMGTTDVIGEGNEDFKEPPARVSDRLKESHVQRANHHSQLFDKVVSRRIFRQGYEFLDPPLPGQALSLGLNFVSFQDSPDRLLFMLTQKGWLGAVNFGGNEEKQPPGMTSLLTAQAAGIFLCPPSEPREDFPGQSIFSQLIA